MSTQNVSPCKRCGVMLTWIPKVHGKGFQQPREDDGKIHDCPYYQGHKSGGGGKLKSPAPASNFTLTRRMEQIEASYSNLEERLAKLEGR